MVCCVCHGVLGVPRLGCGQHPPGVGRAVHLGSAGVLGGGRSAGGYS